MPRRARQYIPRMPYHIVQRGNNREVYFIEPENYQFYLQLWQELSVKYQITVMGSTLTKNTNERVRYGKGDINPG